MSTIRAGVLLSLNNRLSGGLRRASGDVSSFATKAGSAFGRVNRAIGGVTGRLATLGGGLSLAVAAKGVIDMEARLVRLGTQASVGADKVAELRDRVYEVAQDNQIKVDPSQLLDAADAIIERTGDFQFVQDNLRNIGLAVQATGASGDAIGGLFAEFQKMGMSSQEAFQALDMLTLQGKAGAFTLENLAALGPRVINAYTASGRSGVEAVTEMGAALQVIRRGTGSSEQAATAFEAVMRSLTDPAKLKKLEEMQVDVHDASGSFRSIVDIMGDVVAKGGDLESLGVVFDAEAMRAFTAAIAEFKRTGGVESLGEFMQLNADGSTIVEDSARNAATMAANLTNVRTAFRKFAEDNLSEPIQKVADALNAATPEDFDRWASGAKKLALGLLAVKGIAVVGSAMSAVSSVVAARRGGKGRGVLGSMGAGMGGGAMPVYVTNWGGANSVLGGRGGTAGGAVMRHTGARGGTLAALKASARSGGVRGIVARKMFAPAVKVSTAAARSGALGGALRTAGKAAKVLGKGTVGIPLAMSAIEIAAIARNKQLDQDERTRRIGGAAGGAAGAIGGMALGAALGSVVPGIGTLIGGAIGLVGGALGAHLGRKGGEAFGEQINKARDIRAGSVTGQMSPYLAGYASRSLQLEQVKTAAPPPEVNLTTNVNIEESADGFNIETEVYRGGERIAAETGYQARSFVP